MITQVEWKEIPEFPKYKVSNFGEVVRENRVMTPALNKPRGYYYVSVQDRNRRKNFILHRLVASLFIPNPENKPQINHIDGNKKNNFVDNLEWCTASENGLHAFKTGLRTPVRGEKCGASKLTEKDVLEIRQMGKDGFMHKDIAKKYGMGVSTITHILLRNLWKHI